MPIALTNGPGVYIQELPSRVQPIAGVPTSVAAFYGQAPQGQVNFPFQVNSWGDYENQFGSLDSAYPMSYAVYLFFLNGGSTALVVRYNGNAKIAQVSLPVTAPAGGTASPITLEASSPGAWGNNLTATVDTNNLFDPETQFNLTIKLTQPSGAVSQELYTGASLQTGTPQYLPTLLAASQLVTPVNPSTWSGQPDVTPVDKNGNPLVPFSGGVDPGTPPATSPGTTSGSGTTSGPILDFGNPDQKTGIWALLKADIFNILCLPVDPRTPYTATDLSEGGVVKFCETYRAMLIVDSPDYTLPLQFPNIVSNPAVSPSSPNAAAYYPSLVYTDSTGAPFNVGPCGAVAGVWAATDSSRGVWKAPAGTAATITGITGLSELVGDKESGILNPLAVNALRTMPLVGPVVWGARTTVGTDQAQSQGQWKYIPVRRVALYIEESLRRGTQWVVFEPNDEPLWSSLRLDVTTFMQGLFRQGAFAGTTPAQAYLVQCDANNNTPDQVALGIVNILVGFAPLYPAEFVIISIQQQAGQA